MFLLIAFVIIIITYVVSFKNDFTPEHLKKLKPVLAIIIALAVISILISLMGWGV